MATTDLTIRDVRLVANGVRLLGADAVVTSKAVDTPASTGDFDYPFRSGDVPTESTPGSRRALSGTELSAGEQVVPILGVEVTREFGTDRSRPARVLGLVLEWRAADGANGCLTLPYRLRFSPQGC